MYTVIVLNLCNVIFNFLKCTSMLLLHSHTHTSHAVTPFDADSHFTMRAIDRLKVSAGNSVIEELVKHTPTAFPAVAGVDVWEMYNYILGEWASGRGPHPPTWAELFRAFKEMGLSELASRMEKYLRGSVPEDPPRPLPDNSKEQKNSEAHLSHGDKKQGGYA